MVWQAINGGSRRLPLEGSVTPTPPAAGMGGEEEAGETSSASGSEKCDD